MDGEIAGVTLTNPVDIRIPAAREIVADALQAVVNEIRASTKKS